MNDNPDDYRSRELDRIRQRNKQERNEMIFMVLFILAFLLGGIVLIALYWGIIAALIIWIVTEILQVAHSLWH